MSKKKLYRNTKDGKIFGICAGVADYFNIDVVIPRLIAFALLFSGGMILAYIVAYFVVPTQPE